jgi:ABC-type Fe3+ transport system substrate-binding protein
VLLLLIATWGWAQGFELRAADAGGNETVIILTPHVDAIRSEFGRGFAQWHQDRFRTPGRVEWRSVGGTSDALKFIQSEFQNKPDGIGLDILFGGGQEPYLVLADQHLARPHQPAAGILDGVPATLLGTEMYDPKFQWFAAAVSSFGILENSRLLRLRGMEPARRWEDLARPEWFGWVGAGDPRNSGTMYVMFEAILQAYGWEKGWRLLSQIGGNVRRFDRVSSTTAKDVTLGETVAALAIDFYGFTQVAVAGRTNLAFVLPADFTAINVDCIAVLKGAPHPQAAGRFVDFVLSEAGQRLWFLPKGHPQGPREHSIERMSIRPDFYQRYRGTSNIEFSPFDLRQGFIYNAKLSRARREVVQALLGAMLVDSHHELIAAWQAVIRRQLRPEDLAELARMPLTAAEALTLAGGDWKNPVIRNERRIAWQEWARAKYRALCRSSSKI